MDKKCEDLQSEKNLLNIVQRIGELPCCLEDVKMSLERRVNNNEKVSVFRIVFDSRGCTSTPVDKNDAERKVNVIEVSASTIDERRGNGNQGC